MNFHLYSAFYGEHYFKLFKNACFRSLSWPLNREALKGATWNIFTPKEYFERVEQLLEPAGFKVNLFELGPQIQIWGVGRAPITHCDQGIILADGLRHQIRYSIEKNSKMLMAPPDTLFGDGSIANILAIGSQPGTCVSVAHSRVLSDILDDIDLMGATKGAITNAELVTLSFKHAHASWTNAEIGHPKNSSYVSGVAWRKLNKNLWSVQHRLPTVYLASFTPSDWDFWFSQNGFGSWDHRWPAENLVRQERQRFVGSSDAAWIVEITDWDKNVPPDVDRTHLQGAPDDHYWTSHYHNQINRQTNVILRGKPL